MFVLPIDGHPFFILSDFFLLIIIFRHTSFANDLSEIRQKTQRCFEKVYEGLENAYYL